jgi:hypothetical protein
MKPAYLAKNILWNKPSLNEAIKNVEQRQGIKIIKNIDALNGNRNRNFTDIIACLSWLQKQKRQIRVMENINKECAF